jgi:pimeloyl-ACP methyl ester carboxylesterase
MSTFVLVHGAYHGAWCWELLRPELERRGHRSVAVDLPFADPAAGTLACAELVAAAVEDSGDDVVLVGHSLAGLVVPVAAGLRPVRRLVHLCALLPRPPLSFDEASVGEPIFDHFTPAVPAVSNPDGSTSCPEQRAVELFYHDCPPALARWAAARLRPQHWRVTTEATPLGVWPGVPSSYVLCVDDRAVNPGWSRRVARAVLGVEAVELAGGHSPFLSRPAELASALVSPGA